MINWTNFFIKQIQEHTEVKMKSFKETVIICRISSIFALQITVFFFFYNVTFAYRSHTSQNKRKDLIYFIRKSIIAILSKECYSFVYVILSMSYEKNLSKLRFFFQ